MWWPRSQHLPAKGDCHLHLNCTFSQTSFNPQSWCLLSPVTSSRWCPPSIILLWWDQWFGGVFKTQQNSNLWHLSKNQHSSKFNSKKKKEITSSCYFRAQDVVSWRISCLLFGSLFQSTNCVSDKKTCGGGGVLGVLGENPRWKNAGEEQEVRFSSQTPTWGGSDSENMSHRERGPDAPRAGEAAGAALWFEDDTETLLQGPQDQVSVQLDRDSSLMPEL